MPLLSNAGKFVRTLVIVMDGPGLQRNAANFLSLAASRVRWKEEDLHPISFPDSETAKDSPQFKMGNMF